MQLVGMIKLLSGGLQKKFGGPKRPARTALEDGCNGKKRFFLFLTPVRKLIRVGSRKGLATTLFMV